MSYDARLVEDAVLAAVGQSPPETRALFHAERDAIYELRDPEARESAFVALHGRWFVRLALGAPVDQALRERAALLAGTRECRVLPARSRKDEMADLAVDGWPATPNGTDGAGGAAPKTRVLLIRLRPESLVEAGRLLAFLRHEFMHVADMLDPGFGYEKDLAPSDLGPSSDNLLRDRYRVLWDATIDGRLCHQGLLDWAVRESRLKEFSRAFPVLGQELESEFTRWFENARPTHLGLVASARAPVMHQP